MVLTAAATPSGTCLLDMHILRPCPRPAESHTQVGGPLVQTKKEKVKLCEVLTEAIRGLRLEREKGK